MNEVLIKWNGRNVFFLVEERKWMKIAQRGMDHFTPTPNTFVLTAAITASTTATVTTASTTAAITSGAVTKASTTSVVTTVEVTTAPATTASTPANQL
jgi:hypothetical protein